jgi:hypothetical protein
MYCICIQYTEIVRSVKYRGLRGGGAMQVIPMRLLTNRDMGAALHLNKFTV